MMVVFGLIMIVALLSVDMEEYNEERERELMFVFEHYRHGARTPCSGSIDNNLTDIFGYEWEGIGELTTIGLLQHYTIGKRNRERYDGFISSYYNPSEMLIQSTNVNRTIMSAQAHLAGLFSHINTTITTTLAYPPLESYKHLFDQPVNDPSKPIVIIPFIPIPIHTVEFENHPISTETLHFAQEKNCPRNLQYKEDNKRSEKVLAFIDEFKGKYAKFIMKVLNREVTYHTISAVCGAYISEYYEGRDLNLFKEHLVDTDALYKDCLRMSYIKHLEVEMGNKARETGVIIMSSLMRKIVSWMDNRITINEGKAREGNDSPKYVLYSGHDTTISAMQVYMLKAFNIPLKDIPFAAGEVFHLLKSPSNSYYINYYYNDELLLNISYTHFKKTINAISWKDNDIIDYCTKYSFQETLIISLLSFLLIIILIIVSLLTYCCLKSHKKSVRAIVPQ